MRTLFLISIGLLSQFASAGESSLLECRNIKAVKERVACYDAIVDLLFPVADTSTTEAIITNGATPVPSGNSLFGKHQAESKRIVEETLAIKQIDELKTTVTSVKRNAYKKLTVTLDNGQIWKQLDNDPLPLKKGETVIIRSARFGSYLLEKESGSGSIRVKRLN